VKRVGASLGRVDVELEVDPVSAIRDFERHARLEVLRTARAVALAERVTQKLATARVLDIHVHIGAAMEAGQVEQRALVDMSAIGHAHTCSFP
jgi:hypothetical protein